MTKSEFVSEWRHELDGWILDAAMSSRSGSDLSIWLRSMRAKIEVKLGNIYDSLTEPAAKPPAQPQLRKVQ